ncbi:hypothetical protein H6F46_08155 [Limnothrix sp. FACHB-1083]|uniref:hypothetical protein n=1 Tax=unclassified Limnothrix TaxID=2632864 RepID=UPI0016816B57|nr:MULTISPECIES: hypothetical protein [unclassified Limnothrix]MBD2160665.1 hypothetical protein [Limnothrix sp. FACHB-1083]
MKSAIGSPLSKPAIGGWGWPWLRVDRAENPPLTTQLGPPPARWAIDSSSQIGPPGDTVPIIVASPQAGLVLGT